MRYGYKDLGNYYVYAPLVKEPLDLATKSPLLIQATDHPQSPFWFYNTGGTISSCWTEHANGVDCVDLIQVDPLLVRILKEQGINYRLGILKLSEKYTYVDYLTLKSDLQALVAANKAKHNPPLRLIFTHGTDALAYFATWVKLLALNLGFYAVVLCAQRSHDRPTCELHALLHPAIKVLKKLKYHTAVCVTYHDSKRVLLHDAFEIRKFETYRKQAFWSPHMKYMCREDPQFALKKQTYVLRFKEVPENTEMVLENIFNPSAEAEILQSKLVLGSGLGNIGCEKLAHNWYHTRVSKGPLNPLIYAVADSQSRNFHPSVLYDAGFKPKKLLDFSPQALHLVLNVLRI